MTSNKGGCMFFIIFFILLSCSNVYAEQDAPKTALVDLTTGNLTNVGRGIDYSSLTDQTHVVIQVPIEFEEQKAKHLVFKNGSVQKRDASDIALKEKGIQKGFVLAELIREKKDQEALKALKKDDQINLDLEIVKKQVKISKLKTQYEALNV